MRSEIRLSQAQATGELGDTETGHADYWIRENTSGQYILHDTDNDGDWDAALAENPVRGCWGDS